MNKTLTLSVLAIIALTAMAAMIVSFMPQPSQGAAFPGSYARQQVATTTEVGPQETVTIFDEVDGGVCSSRVVSTTDGTGQAIQLLFGDPTNGDVASTSISEVVGHLQAGSTTQAYDSGIYGCGRWVAYAPASTTLLLSEF